MFLKHFTNFYSFKTILRWKFQEPGPKQELVLL